MRDTGRDGSGEEDEDVVFIDFLLFSRQLLLWNSFPNSEQDNNEITKI